LFNEPSGPLNTFYAFSLAPDFVAKVSGRNMNTTSAQVYKKTPINPCTNVTANATFVWRPEKNKTAQNIQMNIEMRV
jgi:hypothetical protein